MAEGSDHRDTDNNWVIPSTESLLVETLGAAHGELPAGHEAVTPEVPEAPVAPEGADAEASGAQEVKGTEPPPLITEVPPRQEQLEIPPEEPRAEEQQPQAGLRRRVGGDLEEVSCSSSDDDVEGLRKRTVSGAPPSSVGASAAREAELLEPDAGSSLIINKCVIAAIALVSLAVLIFTGGFGSEDDSPQSVLTRSVTGEEPLPQSIADIQEWIHQHAEQFTGDPSSLHIMSSLLDKVAKENQDIRHMQATLQDQKEELEALLHAGDGGTPPGTRLTEENVRLKDALLQEETSHLSAKEELQNLQEKLDALEADSLQNEALASENSQLKAELETSKRQMESFLTQKETLVAESQMLRQELDKQRQLVASIRQDLESMTINKTVEEDEKVLRNRVAEMSNRLAMEAQRSESWEKKYVEHAQKRKEQVGEERKVHAHKEWKKGEKWDRAEEQVKKPHVKQGRDHGKRWEEEEDRESQQEEWKSKKHEDKQHWRDKKHRHWEDEKDHHPRQSESWKDKTKEHRFKDSSAPHRESHEKNWKDKHPHHHHRDAGNGFHPRKGQKEFSEAHKHGEEKRKEHGGKDHRHHDHNKFWKKLSDHQYRVPVGCSGVDDCARKDGIDLFNVELKPVERKQFEDVLKNYLADSELSKNLPDLLPLLDGFFEGPHFAHHKIRFKDFVDDVEDFLEDLAKRETGNDDAVEDFERFVYTSFFGDAAKKRSAKKDDHKRSNKPDRQHNPGKPEETPVSSPNQTNPRYHENQDNFKLDTENGNYKPYKARHDQDSKAYRWKKQKKYDHDARRNQNNNNSHDVTPYGEEWDSKEPKYNKRDQTQDHRSHHESAEDHHHDPEKDDRYFHKHKSYKNQDWHKQHHHNHAADHSHQDKYTDQKYSHGKYRAEPRYDPSLTDGDEDTELSYRHQPKNQWKKHNKDAIGERYWASQVHYRGHEDHEHEKHGGHGETEDRDRSGQRYHSKPHYEQIDDNRHKHQDNYKPKSFYDKHNDHGHDHHQENYKHKPYYDNRHKHHHDKQDGSRNKPNYDTPDDNKHKNFPNKQDDNRYKHQHDKQEDSKHRPYDIQEDYEHKHHHHDQRHKPDYNKQEDYDHKHHHHDQHRDKRHKHDYNKQEDYEHKHPRDQHDKQEDSKHRPYDKQEDYAHKHHHHDQHRDKRHKHDYNKQEDYDRKQRHDQYDNDKHRSYYGKHSQGSYHNEDRKHEDVENRHGSSYRKQDHHHRDHKN